MNLFKRLNKRNLSPSEVAEEHIVSANKLLLSNPQDPSENLAKIVHHYHEALTFFTQDRYLERWADINYQQGNLYPRI